MSKIESNDRAVLHHTRYEHFRTQNTTLLNFTNCKSSSSAVNKISQIDFDNAWWSIKSRRLHNTTRLNSKHRNS